MVIPFNLGGIMKNIFLNKDFIILALIETAVILGCIGYFTY